MIFFLIKYIHLQTETAEHAKFYSKTRSKISMKSIKSLVLWIICSFQPDLIAKELIKFFQIHVQNVYLIFTSLFFQNYATFFINISRQKFYLEYKKNFIFLVFMLYLIFIDQVANCIVNNGNILTTDIMN